MMQIWLFRPYAQKQRIFSLSFSVMTPNTPRTKANESILSIKQRERQLSTFAYSGDGEDERRRRAMMRLLRQWKKINKNKKGWIYL